MSQTFLWPNWQVQTRLDLCGARQVNRPTQWKGVVPLRAPLWANS
jgi:hypothetical protein